MKIVNAFKKIKERKEIFRHKMEREPSPTGVKRPLPTEGGRDVATDAGTAVKKQRTDEAAVDHPSSQENTDSTEFLTEACFADEAGVGPLTLRHLHVLPQTSTFYLFVYLLNHLFVYLLYHLFIIL